MSEAIERLLRNSAETFNGWTKLNGNERVIKIGNRRNCNDDGIIRDLTIKKKMMDILNKYSINVEDYRINEINTKFESSFELIIKEETYKSFSNSLIFKEKKLLDRQMNPIFPNKGISDWHKNSKIVQEAII